MSLSRISSVPDRFGYYWIAIVYYLNAMGAYQIFSIPLQWLGSLLAVLSIVLVLYKERGFHKIYIYPLLFILIMFFISVLGWRFWSAYVDFAALLPKGATTSYYLFIFLRYFQYLVFIAVYIISLNHLNSNSFFSLAKIVVVGGVVISLYAIYVYVAQIYGLPEIPRGRIGTGGEEQSVTFTYAFHRAMGSFREPSHLAEWLVLPFFMTFWRKTYWNLSARITIVFVILLTGSLTGIIAVSIGYLFAILLVFQLRIALMNILKIGLVLLFSGYLFSIIVFPNEGGSADIFAVLLDRIIPILEDGLGASNRGHIYEYVTQHSIPLIGYGFGNANLLIGEYMGLGLMGSFLSFYLNMLYSLGYLGFLFAIIVLIAPVFLLLRFRAIDKDRLFVLLGAYFGWLLIYSGLTEELSISFAILYAACVHYYRCQLETISLNRSTISAAI